MIPVDDARLEGLRLAVELQAAEGREQSPFGPPLPALPERVLDTAGQFANWLLARPHRLRLTVAPFTFPEGHPGPGVPTKHQGDGMSVTMSDSEAVTYVVSPEDSKGVAVADTLTWSSDDGGAVVTLTPSADTLSCVFSAVDPGAATISVTDGTLSASDLITVTPGAVASLVLTPGTPVAE